MSSQAWLWIGFHVFVFAMLAIDLGLFHRKEHAVTAKEATTWTLVWVGLSLAFCGGIALWYRPEHRGLWAEWLSAYVVEYALSVDNLFVFLMLFGFFKVKPEHQHRVLFWGIVGAFIMRATLILTGTALVARFHWLLYIFGAFLIYTAVKMLRSDDAEADPEHAWILRTARRVLPVSPRQEGAHFVVRYGDRRMFTPLFLVLLTVEATDLLFAMDSIPAVLALSKDPFIIYTSNVCAILGLRSLFFVVASLMDKFHYLKVGLAIILAFVGVKMIIEVLGVHIPIGVSLAVIAGVLACSIGASWVWPKAPDAEDSAEAVEKKDAAGP